MNVLRIFAITALLYAGNAGADSTIAPAGTESTGEAVTICYNYGCYVHAPV